MSGSARSRRRPASSPTPPTPLPALGHEAGEHDDEDDLAELGRLEVEEADLDPALRAAHLLGEDEDGRRRSTSASPYSGQRTRRYDVGIDGRGDGNEQERPTAT